MKAMTGVYEHNNCTKVLKKQMLTGIFVSIRKKQMRVTTMFHIYTKTTVLDFTKQQKLTRPKHTKG